MVVAEFVGIRFDAYDAHRTATFWAQILDRRLQIRTDGSIVVVPKDRSYPLIVAAADTPKHGQNRIHFDLTSKSSRAMTALVTRALDLGASHADVGQSPNEPHVVLADPEGNEFCVIPPGNGFLADTGDIGAINCDGSQSVGYFWSTVLGWPLVWDHDEETAIQSPLGGSKITWSGPPLMPRAGRDRLRFELAALAPLPHVVAHLLSAGAVLGESQTPEQAVLHDSDGNEFHLLAPPHGTRFRESA